jgi:cytochrome c peroxidase
VGFERISGNVSETLKKLQSKMDQSVPISELVLSDPDFSALGRLAVTGRPGDLSAYRTPTLRNVSLTAPYMHDGSVPTLEEAVQREIYYRSLARGNPISLTVEEQRDLISFLKSLEDKKQ